MESLRVLTSIELFTNAEFYSEHPCFSSVVNDHAEYFSNINIILPMSVFQECLDTGCIKADLVRQEAILNCNEKKWSSFLCILGLTSVLNRTIFTYPDCGEQRFKLLFNRMIQPRLTPKKSLDTLHILFCYEGTVTAGTTFRSNHFVPLLFHKQQLKRKPVAATSQSSTKRQKVSAVPPKKASNITKFFNVAEKSVSKPKSQNSNILDLDQNKPSTSTNTKSNVSETGETPIAKQVGSCATNFDVAMYRDMVKGMSSSEICYLIKNVFGPEKNY
jgi:hypothetical protein